MNDIIQGIAKVGFPAACCVFLLYQNAKQDEARSKELEKLRDILQENTMTLKELVTYLKN